MSARLIAVAMEAAEITLIEQWCNAGKLPNFNQLMQTGYWQKLKSTADVASGGTWPTLHTGCSPAKHGIARSHRHLKTGTYEIHKQYADQVRQDTFWNYLSAKGYRSAILDVPKSFPVANFNGIHLVNWGDEHQSWKQSSWPPEFSEEVIAKYGRHPLEGWYQQKPATPEKYKALVNDLIIGIQLRTQLVSDVLQKESWDLLMVSYSELHWAGHIIWHTMDKNHPDYNPQQSEELEDAMYRCYAAIDKGLGKIRSLDPEAILMIFANSGMGPNYSGRHLITQVLQEIGMVPKKTTNKRSLFDLIPARKWGAQTFENVERFIPIWMIEKAKSIIPDRFWDKYTRKLLYGGNNWKDCIAFSIPSDYSGTIRINLEGREPNGKIKEGAEYDQVCQEIMQAFSELINPETGKKTVKEVIKVRDHFFGPHINELPDIVITWERDAPITAVYSDRIGKITGTLRDKRSGGHESYGFILIHDPKKSAFKSNETAHILDIAPTILMQLGCDIPETMDGKILPFYADQIQTINS
ncbi:MAG: alkaline phosphatase family protein [Saprospiraceae bacterium]|nr:alkaline phosphatase family protein [Saprospiraceae bacterium]